MNFLMVFDFTQFWLDGWPSNEYFWISYKISGLLLLCLWHMPDLYLSLVSPFDPSVSAGLSSCICLESWLQKSIKCTKVKPPCQLRIIKYMQCTWTAKEENERENSSRFLCCFFQYFDEKEIGTKRSHTINNKNGNNFKEAKKSIHSFWHQDCQNTCLLRAYPISGTYVILWHIM